MCGYLKKKLKFENGETIPNVKSYLINIIDFGDDDDDYE
jgi:hypothetical protein